MLLWTDIETSGLDPTRDRILQIAVIPTDERLNELAEPFVTNIWHPDIKAIRESADPVVQKMHDDNGIWEACASGSSSIPANLLDSLLSDYISSITCSSPRYLAGSSVKFDASFIERQCPNSARLLHYRVLDVSSLQIALDITLGKMEYGKPESDHTALADIRNSMRHFRLLQGRIITAS